LLWVVFFVLSFSLAATKAFFPETSPWDEQAHLSYVQYVFSGQLPANGMAIGTWSKEAYSCFPGTLTPIPCGELADARNYPMGGTNSAAFWQPSYYILASMFGGPFVWLGVTPLFAIRIGTALIWAIGVASLSLLITKKTSQLSTGVLLTLTMTALPLFGYMSSAVTPHSLNPLLAALALFTAFKWIEVPEKSLSSLRSTLWPLSFLLSVTLGAWSIPQSLTIFGTVALFISISRIYKHRHSTRSALREFLFTGINILITAGIYLGSMSVWSQIQTSRAVPPVAEVDISRSPGSALDVTYAHFFEQLFVRWPAFWPNGIRAGWDQDDALTLNIELVWVFVLLTLTVVGILLIRRPQWAFFLIIAVVVIAPISSVAYDIYFPSDVPVRYGLGIPVVGLAAVMSLKKPVWLTRMLLVLALLTYIIGFFVEPMFPFDRGCELNGDGIVMCAVG
jgi:hypothetical protein